MNKLLEKIVAFDRVFIDLLRRHSPLALRLALGIVFAWFGALKVAGVSPVNDLVHSTVWWLPPDMSVLVLGVVEIAIGIGLIFRLVPRLVLLLFTLQMLGTFLAFFIVPGQIFEGNLLTLTVLGEFVVKNLVLLAAGLSVAASLPKLEETTELPMPRPQS